MAWVNVETFRPNHFQIRPGAAMPSGCGRGRIRACVRSTVRRGRSNRAGQYPLPYMYGNSSILRCLNGHLQTESITLMNSPRPRVWHQDVDFIGMNRSASRICGCDAVLEDCASTRSAWTSTTRKYPDLHIAPGTAHAFSINADDHRYYHWEFLNALPTLHSGQFSNLKIQTKRVKVWLLRGDEARVFIDIADERGRIGTPSTTTCHARSAQIGVDTIQRASYNSCDGISFQQPFIGRSQRWDRARSRKVRQMRHTNPTQPHPRHRPGRHRLRCVWYDALERDERQRCDVCGWRVGPVQGYQQFERDDFARQEQQQYGSYPGGRAAWERDHGAGNRAAHQSAYERGGYDRARGGSYQDRAESHFGARGSGSDRMGRSQGKYRGNRRQETRDVPAGYGRVECATRGWSK